MRKIKQPFFSYSNQPTIPDTILETPTKTPTKFVSPDMDQIGRTGEEIRSHMINEWDDIEIISDIPEFIALSKDSSYRHANMEVRKRQYEILTRIAEEILSYMIKQGIGVEYIGNIPEFIAQSKDSSYSHAMEKGEGWISNKNTQKNMISYD